VPVLPDGPATLALIDTVAPAVTLAGVTVSVVVVAVSAAPPIVIVSKVDTLGLKLVSPLYSAVMV
jgi:hypothetical protein